jgi:hypothetical protein
LSNRARKLVCVSDLGDPASYLTLQPGADVVDASGESIGTVEHVLADPSVDVFDGIIVDLNPLSTTLRFADADQVDGIFERGVVLKVRLEDLHEPEKNAGTLSATPDDVESSGFEARLRRAWDYISGRY